MEKSNTNAACGREAGEEGEGREAVGWGSAVVAVVLCLFCLKRIIVTFV